MSSLSPWLFIAIGGALGAMSRYAVALLVPISKPGFPWATFLVNIVGSCLIGVCFVLVVEKIMLSALLRHGVMVGFLGALTTFSSFSLETLQLLQNGFTVLAVIYVLASLLACLIAAYFGYALTLKLL